MQRLGQLLVVGLIGGLMLALVPLGAASAAEPLPAGEYTIEMGDDGSASVTVFDDGAATWSTPEGWTLVARWGGQGEVVQFLNMFDIEGDDGRYKVHVKLDKETSEHQVDVKFIEDEDDLVAEPAELDASDGDDDTPNGVAANKDDEAAPGQHGRDNADEKAGEHGQCGRENADSKAGGPNHADDEPASADGLETTQEANVQIEVDDPCADDADSTQDDEASPGKGNSSGRNDNSGNAKDKDA